MINKAGKQALKKRLLAMLDDYCENANEAEDDDIIISDEERMKDFILYYSIALEINK